MTNEKNKIIIRYKDSDDELIEVIEFFKRNNYNLSGFIRQILREKGQHFIKHCVENNLGK